MESPVGGPGSGEEEAAAEARQPQWAGLVGFSAAVVAVAADLLAQFTGDVAHLGDVAAVAADVPVWRLYAGHYLGVAAILTATAGIWQVARLLGSRRRLAGVALSAGALMTGAGAAFHATYVFTGLLVHARPAMSAADQAVASGLLVSFRNAELGLLAGSSAGLVVFSACFALAAARGGTPYPRWCAAANPLLLLAVLFGIGALVRPIGLVTLPAGFNLALTIVFGLSLVAVRTRARRPAAGSDTRR